MAGQNQGGGNVDLFDAYFRRADLDHDGRISGAEAVAFFQGSNLSKQVLAQIWMHADQNRTGFLGRTEFYNALKLVTVAQSKRDLTPDIVKAALYGAASTKIPAPQINFAAITAPQANSGPPAHPQLQQQKPIKGFEQWLGSLERSADPAMENQERKIIGNVDLFDAYFRIADLDHDGRISGAEGVAFFPGSNLSKHVLSQIWMHADQNLTGFLGRTEFYNALKLVTVAQSKHELTPDIVKAALYGAASTKIPAPQINFAAITAPQANSGPPAPAPQVN